jgi:5-formyltetrahydrofolate cyclo-ligase
MDINSLRQLMRTRRRSLKPKEQSLAEESVTRRLTLLPSFYMSKRIAFYLAHDGEIDPKFAMGIAESAGKECYLPLLHPLKQEPLLRGAKIVPPFAIDLIIMPLVAFDSSCNRVGMGGGFYDRTLSTESKNTRLIGLAQSIQETSAINKRSWDVTLHTIVTEKSVVNRYK